VCMITGGLGGFASSISELMLKRGARIWCCDLKQEDEGMLILQNQFSEAFDKNNIGYCRCDVTSENEFDAAFVQCIEKMGDTPTVLINAAGIMGEEQWENLYDINLKGTHRGIELAFKYMGIERKGGKGGVVMNISSTAGITCKPKISYALPAYYASKHAVTSLTRCFGQEYWFNKTQVKVIAMAPYWIDTPLLKNEEATFPELMDELTSSQTEETNEYGGKVLEPGEAATKLINCLNANNGSIWMMRPNQMQVFNVADYVLPKPQNAKPCSFPKVYGML